MWLDIHSGRDRLAFLAGEGKCVFTSAHSVLVCVCKRASHICSWWQRFSWTDDDERKVCVPVRLTVLYTPQCILSALMRGDVRATTCRSASTVQSFPVAALDQRALVKPWTWTSWVWKNLSQNNYNLSKYQRHACSFQLCSVFLPLSRGRTRQAEAPFLMRSFWERRSQSIKTWLGTLASILL